MQKNYESEAQLESRLLALLEKNGYERLSIHTVEELEDNFRMQVSKHNSDILDGRLLSDKEFNRLLTKLKNIGTYKAATELRQKHNIELDDGSNVYLELFNKSKWCKNIFQVTNQITVNGKYETRFDVTILINGLPMIQIELKKRGGDLIEAFNQVKRYKRNSYNVSLFDFIQIFVISNGVDTKYFANTETADRFNYKFSFFWSDDENNRMSSLEEFSVFFLEKCHAAKMIARYIIINKTEKSLIVMRPYQVYAVERLINQAINTKSNGYIWHTTGSGKTITSFKASQILALEHEEIDQVFFLVDRKDLDKQTLDEFNKFDPGSVDMTDRTDKLVKQIADSTKPLIITTIQKMANACGNERFSHVIDKYADKKVIFIIDECHRSQFGDMHKIISNKFINAQYFGFTGTPRFDENKSQDDRTTDDIFDKCLHKYQIKDAIKDGNVLAFSIDYINTIKGKNLEDKELVAAIDTKEVLADDERISLITDNIIKTYKTKTNNKMFNAIFATSSIPVLTKYYDEFKKHEHNLKVAAIFTYAPNAEFNGEGRQPREVLEDCINDYNKMFDTDYTIDTYDKYFADICKKIKNTELDLVLVVDMLLTGFDAKRLNTLFVDKYLQYHNLIQAFSRTNRIESDAKQYGNIVSYQTPKAIVDKAIQLYSSDPDIVVRPPYSVYLDKYKKALEALYAITLKPEDVDNLESEEAKKAFIDAFRELSKVLIVIKSFKEFAWGSIDIIMTEQENKDFVSKYTELYRSVISKTNNPESILSDIEFSLELIRTDKINVAYILNLIRNIDLTSYDQRERDIKDIEAKLVNVADDELYLKAELIKKFLRKVVPILNEDDSIDEAYDQFMNNEKESEIYQYATSNDIEVMYVKEAISSYEFSGVIPSKKVKESINAEGFLQRRKIEKGFNGFIKEVSEKYS